jgi:hypothetical protein
MAAIEINLDTGNIDVARKLLSEKHGESRDPQLNRVPVPYPLTLSGGVQ